MQCRHRPAVRSVGKLNNTAQTALCPTPGRGPFFCVRAAAGARSISGETMGKNIRVRTAILVLFVARQTGARQCCEKNHSNALQCKSCETARKSCDFAGDSALLPTDPAKLCTECQSKFGCNIVLKFFQRRDFLDKFYLRESFMRKIHK